MQSNNSAAHLPRAAQPAQKIDLVFEDDGRVALRSCTWTEGLGWCCQKTIRLDAEQLEDLHRSITVARHRLARNAAESGRDNKPAQVIKLPSLA